MTDGWVGLLLISTLPAVTAGIGLYELFGGLKRWMTR